LEECVEAHVSAVSGREASTVRLTQRPNLSVAVLAIDRPIGVAMPSIQPVGHGKVSAGRNLRPAVAAAPHGSPGQ
jgi:hypothetical protein